MGYIQINSVSLFPEPTVDTLVTVMRRLTSDPDVPASYNTETASLNVPTGGVLTTPYTINSLLDNTSYTLKVFDDCGSFYQGFTTVKITTAASCPAITSIAGSGSTGGAGGTGNTLLNVYVGAKDKTTNPTGAEILLGIHSNQDVTLDVLADWTSFLSTPQCLWFAIEAASVLANKNFYRDNANADNYGNIATTSDLFPAAQTVLVNGVPYYTSTTNYPTQVGSSTSTFKLQKV